MKEAPQNTGKPFEAEKYVGNYPVKKHDHVLIPAGTVHCSGRNSMVLEISATPYIFTFKLWDWGRLGLDGRPRPINIGHGKHVIQWNRTEPWVRREIYNKIDKVAEGDGWIEEHTGLHECEFIEIDEPSMIAWKRYSKPLFQVVALFEEIAPDKTKLIFKMLFDTAQECAKLKPFVVNKNEENFDKLEIELTKMTS